MNSMRKAIRDRVVERWPGVPLEQIEAEVDRIYKRLAESRPRPETRKERRRRRAKKAGEIILNILSFGLRLAPFFVKKDKPKGNQEVV